jgi:hypothetical protein
VSRAPPPAVRAALQLIYSTHVLIISIPVLFNCSNNIKTLPDELGALTKLKEVYFNGNPITAIPPTLAGWGSLEEGSFKFCKLKALPP